MVSFIIISKNENENVEYVNQQCDSLHISPFDRIVLSKDTAEKATDKSIGIAEIKILQKKIYLKPMQGTDKAVIIKDAMLLTSEAQNAMLKVLEEPPKHTYIFILTDSLSTLLPTIISRCKIIQLQKVKKIAAETVTDMTNFLHELPIMTLSKKLQVAEKTGKQKQLAVEWLENLQIVIRTLLITSVKENKNEEVKFYMQFAKHAQKATTTIQETNVNVRLAVEHLLLIAQT